MTDIKKEKLIAKRRKQQLELTKELLKRLKTKVDLHHATKLRLSKSTLEVFIVNDKDEKVFASDVEFFNSTNWDDRDKNNLEINFGSSGSFSPKDLAPIVRTKHAMEFLNNWKETTELIFLFMDQLNNLQKTWSFENELLND